jgi:GH24 family phage-related lysozyme (muramidase)
MADALGLNEGEHMDIRQSAIDRTAGFESYVGYFYLDTTGNVTVGYGHMVPDADTATSIALKLNGADASDQAKKDEWNTIHSKDSGHVASYYQQFTTLTLDQSDGKTLLGSDLANAASDLAKRFPSLDTYPDAAQDALLDMIFNIGMTNFSSAKWPSLFAAVNSQDWRTAAAQCNRPDVGDDRNNAIRDLFLSVAAPVAAAGNS